MRKYLWLSLLAIPATLLLSLTACSDDDDGGSDASPTAISITATSIADVPGGSYLQDMLVNNGSRPPYTFALALGVSVAEIIIVVTKFALFLAEPQWDIWTTNWFINKCFVLACFVLLLGSMVMKPGEFRRRRADGLRTH